MLGCDPISDAARSVQIGAHLLNGFFFIRMAVRQEIYSLGRGKAPMNLAPGSGYAVEAERWRGSGVRRRQFGVLRLCLQSLTAKYIPACYTSFKTTLLIKSSM